MLTSLQTQTQHKEFQSKAYITTKMVECPLNISGTLTCKHQYDHASRWQSNLCMHAVMVTNTVARALVADQSSTVLLVSRWGQPADGKPGDGITKTMRRPCGEDTAASTNCWE
ncbi:hypothetical protein MUK42_35530 [Musa troglodytarum]|uniref:Uncharacterized protein n=1 Tax=Musa troglodytarum TaxID=320322 RepID=A0A9E7FD91_9LILI|nr:hypothetical protein MUK42_35530 [Musa troglodytarum]